MSAECNNNNKKDVLVKEQHGGNRSAVSVDLDWTGFTLNVLESLC